MAKKYEDLEFTDNFMFIKIMTENPDLCAELIGLILQKKVIGLRPAIYEDTINPAYESRGIRLDVYVEDEEDRRYDVEMQVNPEKDLYLRGRYYHSTMDVEMLHSGQDYTELKDSFVIFICKNGIHDGYEMPICTIRSLCVENIEKPITDGICTVIVDAECDNEEYSQELRDFLKFVKDSDAELPADGLAGRLQTAVDEAIISGKWSSEYMRWEDEINHIKFMARKEEQKNTEAERQRADAEQKRADALEAEVAELKKRLGELESKLASDN